MADRSVEIRFQAQVAGYEQAMNRAAQATRKVEDAGKQTGTAIGKVLSGGLQALARTTALAATGAGVLAASVLKTGASYNTLEQQARAAFTTLLGSGEAAGRMMDQIAEFGQSSPFPRQAFIEGAQQLVAFGMEAERVIPTMGAVQDAVAAAGGSSQQLSEVIFVLAQITAAGKITGQDLMQLGQRGINAADLIGQSLGKSGAEIRDSITAGTLDATVAVEALVEGMQTSFGGAAENVKNTWIGATDRIAGAWRDLSSLLVDPLITKSGGGWALDWANAVADALRAVIGQAEPLVEVFRDRAEPAVQRFTERLQGIAPAIAGADLRGLITNLDEVARLGPLIGATGAALFAMGTQNLPILSQLGITGVNPLVAGLAALVALHPDLRGLLGDFLSNLSPLVPVLERTALGLADAGAQIVDALVPGLGALLDALAPVVVAIGTGLGDAAVLGARALVPLAEAVGGIAEVVAMIPTPIGTAIAAFMLFRGISFAPLIAGLSGVRQQMQLQATLAAAAGHQVGFMGTAAATASVSVQRLGTALKTAFISNPVGIALAGLTTIYAAFASQNARTKQQVDEVRASLDQQTGAVTDNTRAWAAKELQEGGYLDQYAAWGGDIRDLTDAIMGDADARERVAAVTRAAKEADGSWKLQMDENAWGLTNQRTEADALLGTVYRLAGVTLEQVDAQAQLAEATADAGVGMEEAGRSARSYKAETDRLTAQAEAFAAVQERRWIPAVERAAQAGEEAAEAHADWVQSMADASEAFVSGSEALSVVNERTREWAQAQADATESAEDSWEDYWDGQSVNVDEWIAELERMVQAQSNWETNMIILAGRASQGVVDEFERMGVEGAPLLQAVIDGGAETIAQLEPIFGDGAKRATQAYADSMADASAVIAAAAHRWGWEIAQEIAAALEAEEMTVAQVVEAYDLEATIDLLANQHPFEDALNASLALGNESFTTPKILGDADVPGGFNAELSAALGRGDASTSTPSIAANASGPGLFLPTLADILRKADDSTGTPDLDADDSPGRSVLRTLLRDVDHSWGTVNVDAKTGAAKNALDTFFRGYDRMRLAINLIPGVGLAHGGIVERRADGGFDEAGRYAPRQSMMGGPAYGRTNILWGEPETGWEAYISGKSGNRSRSLAVLAETIRRMRVSLGELAQMGLPGLDELASGMRPGLSRYANGGFAWPMGLTFDVSAGSTQPWADAIKKAATDWMISGGAAALDTGAALGQGMRWPAIWAMIRGMIPGAIMTSNYRARRNTATGFRSYHNMGRAVDFVSPNMRAATVALSLLRKWTELYHTPAGSFQQRGGRRNPSLAPITRAQHYDHVHAALDKGGIIEALTRPKAADTGRLTLTPGWNLTWNGLGRDEHMQDISRLSSAYSTLSTRVAGGGSVPAASLTATLDARSAALLEKVAAVADRPVSVQVDSREVARAGRRGEASFGPPGRWGGQPRLGRTG